MAKINNYLMIGGALAGGFLLLQQTGALQKLQEELEKGTGGGGSVVMPDLSFLGDIFSNVPSSDSSNLSFLSPIMDSFSNISERLTSLENPVTKFTDEITGGVDEFKTKATDIVNGFSSVFDDLTNVPAEVLQNIFDTWNENVYFKNSNKAAKIMEWKPIIGREGVKKSDMDNFARFFNIGVGWKDNWFKDSFVDMLLAPVKLVTSFPVSPVDVSESVAVSVAKNLASKQSQQTSNKTVEAVKNIFSPSSYYGGKTKIIPAKKSNGMSIAPSLVKKTTSSSNQNGMSIAPSLVQDKVQKIFAPKRYYT